MIKVIIFDVGGVLYKRSYYGYYRNSFAYFSKKLDVEPDKIKNEALDKMLKKYRYKKPKK